MKITGRALIIEFGTPVKDEVIKLQVSKPSDTLDGTTIKAAADAIVATGVFGNIKADQAVTSVKTAYYVIQQEQDLPLA